MLPSIYVSPLKLYSATKINLHGISGSALFRNHLKVFISPLKSLALKNSTSKNRRSVIYPSISKCTAKRCSCCNIYVVNSLSNLTLMADNFLLLRILILIEDQLMLFRFYL